jgi:hypothetical protein
LIIITCWRFKERTEKQFTESRVNWTGVGFSLFPRWWRIAPNKFSMGSVFMDNHWIAAHLGVLKIRKISLRATSALALKLG